MALAKNFELIIFTVLPRKLLEQILTPEVK